jgi:hypothetical protein
LNQRNDLNYVGSDELSGTHFYFVEQ